MMFLGKLVFITGLFFAVIPCKECNQLIESLEDSELEDAILKQLEQDSGTIDEDDSSSGPASSLDKVLTEFGDFGRKVCRFNARLFSIGQALVPLVLPRYAGSTKHWLCSCQRRNEHASQCTGRSYYTKVDSFIVRHKVKAFGFPIHGL